MQRTKNFITADGIDPAKLTATRTEAWEDGSRSRPNEANNDENDAGETVKIDERRWWDNEKPERKSGVGEAAIAWKGERVELFLSLSQGAAAVMVALLTAVTVTLLPLFSLILFFSL
ncbi:hypothetical protein PIB30_032981 [Stylosanthes scabra]|uniref:Uncharacterized protein n=1 Tax=Stylosanthes scabra TaxID=79078 RepID=A0ABU6SDU4_9FABA|nr:hypothetical protein [Stylosanthes scabra]